MKSSWGGISMVGTDQALYIDSVLRRRLSASEYQRRRVLCGNASQFQGDERDVLFISMVNSPKAGGPLAMRQREDFRKIVKVAASRARDQLWVVHSLEPGRDLKPGDLRHRLISHAENPAALRPKRVASAPRFRTRGASVRAPPGVWRPITPALRSGRTRARSRAGRGGWPSHRSALRRSRELSSEGIAESFTREVTLEQLGWRFVRVRDSEFFRGPEKALHRLDKRLAALDLRLPPELQGAEVAGEPEGLDPRVRKRAEQIRARWQDVPSVSSVLGPAAELDTDPHAEEEDTDPEE